MKKSMPSTACQAWVRRGKFPNILERSNFEILNSVKESLISERAALCEVGLLNIIIGDLPISATRLPVSAGSKKISSVL